MMSICSALGTLIALLLAAANKSSKHFVVDCFRICDIKSNIMAVDKSLVMEIVVRRLEFTVQFFN